MMEPVVGLVERLLKRVIVVAIKVDDNFHINANPAS